MVSLFIILGEGRGVSRCQRRACTVSCFRSRLLRSSSCVFCLFVVFFLHLLSRICPDCPCMKLFLVPYSFSVFCCSRCVQVQALQHYSKESQISVGWLAGVRVGNKGLVLQKSGLRVWLLITGFDHWEASTEASHCFTPDWLKLLPS